MLTILTGKNDYRLQAELRQILDAALKAFGDLGIEKLDAQETDADTIVQTVQSVPFLVPGKLILVKNAQGNSALLDRAEELKNRIADGVDVVLVGPVFDKRKTVWNILKKQADKIIECNEAKPFELPQWVVEEAGRLQVKISKSDASYLVDRVGPNQMLLSRELEKLAIIESEISREHINELCEPNPQSSIFDMLDAAFAGRTGQALDLYKQQRKQQVDPHYIIAMLTWQLQALALAVYANPATEQSLIGAGQSPYSARKSLSLARSISRKAMKRYVADLAGLDAAIKNGADADTALETYILMLGNSY